MSIDNIFISDCGSINPISSISRMFFYLKIILKFLWIVLYLFLNIFNDLESLIKHAKTI